MSEESTEKVTIQKADIEITLMRKNIMEIKQTHDGIVFNLKEGMHLYAADAFMTPETKDKIITTFDSFKNVDIIINLSNPRTPVSVKVK